VITHKRDVVSQPFVTHLTPSLRIKVWFFKYTFTP